MAHTTTTMHEVEEIPPFNLYSPEFKKDAYAIYDLLRKHRPIHPFILPSGKKAWLVTKYADAVIVLKDNNRFIKDPRTLFSPEELKGNHLPPELYYHMLNSDPPNHTRLRALVQKTFTPRMIERLKEKMQEISNRLLDIAEEKGNFDLIEGYAFPFPIMVICEMLGVPVEDQEKFRDWSTACVSSNNNPQQLKQAAPKIKAFIAYLGGLIEKRRKSPQEDLVSSLVYAESEGSKLTQEELYAMIFVLIVAGHETTVNLIGNGVHALLQRPDQLEKLKTHPELIETAIEEFLRFCGPVEISTNRWAAEDIKMYNQTISKKDTVFICLASANRDPKEFENPNQLDITRKQNKHLAFGLGSHYCLGASLARLEGQIAINSLLRRFPSLKMKSIDVEYRGGLLGRSLVSLPVQL